MIWEYHIVDCGLDYTRTDGHEEDSFISNIELDVLGNNGWELVSTCFDSNGSIVTAVFKRQVQ